MKDGSVQTSLYNFLSTGKYQLIFDNVHMDITQMILLGILSV